jgi:hypothetical protein
MRGWPLTAAGKPIPSRSARSVTAGSVAPVDYRSGRRRPARLRVPKTSSALVVVGLCTATRSCWGRVSRRVWHRRRALVMMRCCATSIGRPRCDPRTGDIAAATQDRLGQGRRNPDCLPPDHAPAPSSRRAALRLRPHRVGAPAVRAHRCRRWAVADRRTRPPVRHLHDRLPEFSCSVSSACAFTAMNARRSTFSWPPYSVSAVCPPPAEAANSTCRRRGLPLRPPNTISLRPLANRAAAGRTH